MPASFWPEFALLCGAGLIGLICLAPCMLELVSAIIKRDAKPPPVPKWKLIALTSAQSFVLVAVATGVGLLIAHHTDLGAPLLAGLLSGKSVRAPALAMIAPALAMIAPALILGILSASVLLVMEITVFWPRLPKAMQK